MNNYSGSVEYGNRQICYEVACIERKTLEIAVNPDTTVTVRAPLNTPPEKVLKIVTKRARWITEQKNFFSQFCPKTPKRLYVGGETHLYLGRQYRLKIISGEKNSVKLSGGYFNITTTDRSPENVKLLLDAWYRNRAEIVFSKSLENCWKNIRSIADEKPEFQIRKMKKRYGSLSTSGVLTLNPVIILSPKTCIDYVVTHELCHLKYYNHSPDYYRLLEQIMPDWKERKQRMEILLA
ncbi:M48 family metallopeptidase [Methanoplanus endosymbiosus]|uniref:M48 family metallopeptidase n=1 Tax=Methanoplanus endosymbiosus TaxID=33865 RepID=A0A9E7TMX7_9EURY|nr:SprT family zinc-dependent metalloprotease [Methanoplanus endosymbiosus]UUX93811.1 M48 family metallopeptidase [Methanoplanus endosymbiosus]